MSIMFSQNKINSMKLNGHKIVEGKLNGQVVFKFEGTPYMSLKIKVDNDHRFAIPFINGDYKDNLTNISILWGDGTQTIIDNGNVSPNSCFHEYASSGTYDILIYSYDSKIPRFSFQEVDDYPVCLTEVNTPLLRMINLDGTTATNLEGIFYGASNLTYIPNNLFDNNTTATNFSYCFYGADNLGLKIPESLFSKCLEMRDASYIFANTTCVIPTGIFNNNTKLENLSYAFNNRGGKLYPIDADKMFMTLINLTNLEGCFSSSLVSSFPNLNNNLKLQNVSKMFFQVETKSRIYIPTYYFRNNVNITNFSYCFSDINYSGESSAGVYFNENIFCDESTEMGTRFAGKTINFSNCFSDENVAMGKGYNNGTVPQLWNYTFGAVNKTSCFSGENNKHLTNYYIIPEEWGGSYKENSMVLIIDTNLNQETQNKYSLPWMSTTYSNIGNITIDWGDGNTTSILNKEITNNNKSHTYNRAVSSAITITSDNGNIPPFELIAGEEIYCTLLQEVVTPLLHMCDPFTGEGITTLSCFAGCTNLISVYDGVFSKNRQATKLDDLFKECKKIYRMNPKILEGLDIISLEGAFANSGISSLSTDFMKKCPNIQNVSNMFRGCSFIKSIPEDFFKYNQEINNFDLCFSFCSSLTTIPPDLFRYNTNATGFFSCFQNCSSLLNVPEYLFRYNLKSSDFRYVFAGCSNLTINKNIFCDEDTEMETRFSSGDIYIDWDPSLSTLAFDYAFEEVNKGEAPQLWNYKYQIKVNEGDESNPNITILDWVSSSHCFSTNTDVFTNNLMNYSLIPSSWGGEYTPHTMKFKINTARLSSTSSGFILPFIPGTYEGLGDITIDWGDGDYEEKNIVVGDNLSNATLALHFPENLSDNLVSHPDNNFIICGTKQGPLNYDLSFKTSYYDDGSDWDAMVFAETNGKASILIPEGGLLYSRSTYNVDVINNSLSQIGYYANGIYVTEIDSSNPAYQYIKLRIPKSQTKITDGVITEDVCKHYYSTPGEYTITITSSNDSIPKMQNNYSSYSIPLITKLNDVLLHMIDFDGSDVTDINHLFKGAAIEELPISLFYYNQNIENISGLFENNKFMKVPDNFFRFLSKLKDVSDCFSNCPFLMNIPKNLFYNNHLLENVSSCFDSCVSLAEIPGTLFLHNPLINNFSDCFKSCSSITSIGENLFCDENTDKEIRFANSEVNFSNCFSNAGASENTITLPDLWNYNYYLVDSLNCFYEFNGTPTNWDEVPVGWGGNKKMFSLDIFIPEDSLSFVVPFKIGTYSYAGNVRINWGDGNEDIIGSNVTQEQCTHVYENSGNYTITLNVLRERMPIFSFGETAVSNSLKLLSVGGTLGLMSNKDEDIIYTPEGEPINVVNFDYMFSGCSNLTKVSSSLLQLNVGDIENNVLPNAIRMFEDSGIQVLQSNFFPILGEDVNACFYNCRNLIKIPKMRGATNYNSCFYGCSSLKDIPSDTFAWRGQSNIKSKTFNFCFSNCNSLVSIPNDLFLFLDEEGVDEFVGCFNNCINLETIPDNLFAHTTAVSYSGCFSGCNKLKINPNIFGMSNSRFSKLKNDQTVDLSSLFSLTNSFIGISVGKAPELWNYAYSLENYLNIFKQENDKSESKSGVEINYNTDSTILINGVASAQTDFSSNTFIFNVSDSKWYNFMLEHNEGTVTQTSTYLLKVILTNSIGEEYYSKIFTTIDDFNKWEGLQFPSSASNVFQLTIRVYNGNSYDNFIVTPKLSVARVNYSQCFKGQTINSLSNYNDIPDSWK